MAISDNPLWQPSWDGTPGDPMRRLISVDVARAYALVEGNEIEEARSKWGVIRQSIIEKIRSIRLFSSDDVDRNAVATKKTVLEAMYRVARQLYVSTNNEPLLMEWREATKALFSRIE